MTYANCWQFVHDAVTLIHRGRRKFGEKVVRTPLNAILWTGQSMRFGKFEFKNKKC